MEGTIYLAKLGLKSCETAANVVTKFGITAKAVRDMWTGKTRTDQTRCVSTMQEAKTIFCRHRFRGCSRT